TVLLASGYGTRLATSRLDFGREARFDSWRQAVQAGLASPILGIGPGNLRIVVRGGHGPLATAYAHNEYVQSFAETGVVGLVGVLAALVLFAAWAVRSRPQRVSKRARTVWAAAVAACTAFVVQSSMDLIWRFPALVAIAFVWLAIALAPRGLERGEDQP